MANLDLANAERWSRVDGLFLEAVDLPETDRARYLNEACGIDAKLRDEVLALLRYDGPGTESVDLAIQQVASRLADDDFWLGRTIGSYRIKKELGVGGMGAVYLAERADERFEKQVAIKVVHRAMDTQGLRERLIAERRILAALDHPYIAKLIDGGETAEGIPYFVMEYVDGQPVHRFAAELSVGAKCALMMKICEGVAYAHQRLVVHLDLKPSNILVTAEGMPKLLDFGIAGLLRSEEPTPGPHAFTPAYASPEAASGSPISIAADVYSLGVILREMLTGRRDGSVNPDSPDLKAIVDKATAVDPDARYASPSDLAADLSRSLRQYPVRARGTQWTYRAGRFLLRNRLAVAGITLAFALLGATTAVAMRERSVAEQRAKEAQEARASAEREHGEAVRERDRAVQQTKVAEHRLEEFTALADNTFGDLSSLLERLPGATQGRRQIVADTMVFLDKARIANPDNLPLLTTVASGYLKLAQLQGQPFSPNLGDTEGARLNLEKAETISRKHPADERMQITWLQTQAMKADLLEGSLHPKEGLHVTLSTLAVMSAWRRANPGSEALITMESSLLVKASRLSASDPALAVDGVKQIQTAIQLAEPLFRKHPGNGQLAEALASAYGLRQQALSHTRQRETIFDDGNRAIEIYEGLLRRNPDDVVRMRALAMTHQWQARVASEVMGDTVAAKRGYRKAMPLLERISNLDPANAMAKDELALVRHSLGYLLTSPSEREEGLSLMLRSATHWEEVLRTRLSPTQMNKLADVHSGISRLQWLNKDAAGAVEHARRSLQLSQALIQQEPENTMYQVALLTAYGRLLAPAGKILDPKEAVALSEDAIRQAGRFRSENRLRRFLPRLWICTGDMYVEQTSMASACKAYSAGVEAWDATDESAKHLPGIEREIAAAKEKLRACRQIADR